MSSKSKKTGGAHSHRVPPKESLQIQKQAQIQQIYSGPLPQPEDLEKYNTIVPGAAERIIIMAEKQAKHRQELEKIAIKSGDRNSLLGQIFGFIIGLAAISAGSYGIYKGVNLGGIATIISTIGALVYVFVYGSQQRRKERENKWEK